jgi:hypothetical protein
VTEDHGIRSLLVHPAAWEGIVRFIESRGLYVFQFPEDPDADFPSYGIGIGPEIAKEAARAEAPEESR